MEHTVSAVLACLWVSLLTGSANAAPTSKIYVLTASALHSFSPDGHPVEPTLHLAGCPSTGLAVDTRGTIYISSHCNRGDIRIFDPAGRELPGRHGGGKEGVAVSPAGRVATTERRDKINRNWVYGIIHWRSPEDVPLPPIILGVDDIYALAFDRQENIYALMRSLHQVRIFDPNGRAVRVLKLPAGPPSQVTVGSDNKIYVTGAPSVSVFTPEGKKIPPDIGRDRLNLGDNAAPIGVAVDDEGKIYVGYAGGDIGVYQPDGKLASPFFRGPRDIVALAIH